MHVCHSCQHFPQSRIRNQGPQEFPERRLSLCKSQWSVSEINQPDVKSLLTLDHGDGAIYAHVGLRTELDIPDCLVIISEI